MSHAAGRPPAPPHDGRIPIVVGVTGHRDLREEDIAGLEQRVAEFFQRLRSNYPNTPVVTLSQLAEGADRLAARVALDNGASLVVPLPMPADEYEHDFATEESRMEFRELLGRAQASFVVPPPVDGDPPGADSSQHNRPQCYLNAGLLAARYSHILLALWNGLDSASTGGTSHIVRLRLSGPRESQSDLTFSKCPGDCGPVYHVVTPRASEAATAGEPLSSWELHPPNIPGDDDRAEVRLERCLRHTEAYNRDALRAHARRGGQAAESDLVPADVRVSLPGDAASILEFQAVAGSLARSYQSRARTSLQLMLFLAVMGYFCFELYQGFLTLPGVLLLYPVALLLAYLWHLLALRRQYQDKHLDYRALAEGLRTQFYWTLCGLDDDAADFPRQGRTGDMEWIRRALRAAALACRISSGPTGPGIREIELTQQFWVNGQLDYYDRAGARDAARLRRQGKAAAWFFSSALALVLATVGLGLLKPHVPEPFQHLIHTAHSCLIMLIGMQFAVAAAITGYIEKMGFAEQARKYSRMRILFARASARLAELLAGADTNGARRLIRDLGIEALEENWDWVVLHKSRPIDVPKI